MSRSLVNFVAVVCSVASMSAQNRNAAAAPHPDLQGNWMNTFATPLERPKELADTPLLSDQQVSTLNKGVRAATENGGVMVVPSGQSLLTLLEDPSKIAPNPNYDAGFFTSFEFENRTSLITDPPNGRLPAYTPEGQHRRDAKPPATVESVQDLGVETRCLTFGVPRIAGVAGSASAGIYAFYQIVQSPKAVVFFMEAIHEARVIHLDGSPHLPASIRAWDGDSRGRWEGDTLVVDTTNFRPEMKFLGAGKDLRLIERFRLAGPNELQYEVRFEDPTTWTQPWTAMIRLRRTSQQLYEFACHEGNARVIEDVLSAAMKR